MALVHIAVIPFVIILGFVCSVIFSRLSGSRKDDTILPVHEALNEKIEVCYQKKITAMRPRLGSFCRSFHEGAVIPEAA